MNPDAQNLAVAQHIATQTGTPLEMKHFDTLEAMQQAEHTLTREQCNTYNSMLIAVTPVREECQHPSQRWTWGRNGSERREAFLRTIGKYDYKAPVLP